MAINDILYFVMKMVTSSVGALGKQNENFILEAKIGSASHKNSTHRPAARIVRHGRDTTSSILSFK